MLLPNDYREICHRVENSDMPHDTKPTLILMRERLAEFIAWADAQGETFLAIKLDEARTIIEDQVGSNDS